MDLSISGSTDLKERNNDKMRLSMTLKQWLMHCVPEKYTRHHFIVPYNVSYTWDYYI